MLEPGSDRAPSPVGGEGDAAITPEPTNEAGTTEDGADAGADGAVAWTPVPLSCSTAAPGGVVQDLAHQKEIVGVRRTSARRGTARVYDAAAGTLVASRALLELG